MRNDALFNRYELFAATGVVAAHASSSGGGFRQRDVRFLIELFSNWIEASLDGEVLNLSNTQVLRYLDALVEEGFARKSTKDKKPSYKLSRVGLIELLNRMHPGKELIRVEQFCFLFYFVESYRELIIKLIEDEGKQFPLALKMEVENLLDSKALIDRQIENLKREITKLEERISDSIEGSKLSTELFKDKLPLIDVAKQVENRYPYQLNSQKPLSELLKSIPENLAKWELQVGGIKRAEHLFEPNLKLLKAYLDVVESLGKKSS